MATSRPPPGVHRDHLTAAHRFRGDRPCPVDHPAGGQDFAPHRNLEVGVITERANNDSVFPQLRASTARSSMPMTVWLPTSNARRFGVFDAIHLGVDQLADRFPSAGEVRARLPRLRAVRALSRWCGLPSRTTVCVRAGSGPVNCARRGRSGVIIADRRDDRGGSSSETNVREPGTSVSETFRNSAASRRGSGVKQRSLPTTDTGLLKRCRRGRGRRHRVGVSDIARQFGENRRRSGESVIASRIRRRELRIGFVHQQAVRQR